MPAREKSLVSKEVLSFVRFQPVSMEEMFSQLEFACDSRVFLCTVTGQ